MRLATLLLADHAEAVNGKLYLVGGGWDVIYAPKLPTIHPHLSLAVTLKVPWKATNQRHTFEVALLDSDEQPVLPQSIQGEFETGRPPGMRPDDESAIQLVMNFNNLPFERPARYHFTFSVDGSELGRVDLRVVEVRNNGHGG